MNRDSAIGVFDSGIGGLTVLQKIMEALPKENTVYLGDTARSPYGTKSVETVLRYSFENTDFLMEKGVKLVVVACNTSTAIALESLRENVSVPVIGVIEPGVRAALKQTRNGKIGIIGTEATIQSGAYTRALKKLDSKIEVYSRACPLFVPLVEEGWLDNAVVKMTVESYLGSLKQSGIDTLILGCTHYGILEKQIQKMIGPKIKIISGSELVGKKLKDYLSNHKELEKKLGKGKARVFYSTKLTANFTKLGSKFFGSNIIARKAVIK